MLIAHRGFRTPDGENRFVDFQNALKLCKAVEFDIRLTKDKRVIIFHDHHFKRICGVSKTVRQLTYDEIKELDFFVNNPEWTPCLFVEEFIAKLADQYKLINVEIKPSRYTMEEYEILLNSLKLLRSKTDAEIIVSSFGKNDLLFISRLSGEFKKGYLVEAFSNIDFELIKQFDFINPYVGTLKIKKSKEIIDKVNLPMNVWTFKKNIEVEIIQQIYGKEKIHGYISDIPDLKID